MSRNMHSPGGGVINWKVAFMDRIYEVDLRGPGHFNTFTVEMIVLSAL
jgi:hypothetical protein